MDLPRAFLTQHAEGGQRAIVVRDGLDLAGAGAGAGAAPLLDLVAAVRWSRVYHAYGPAADVEAQLIAAVVGDDETRNEAWWNLWGNILHQGTVYEATVSAVPILAGLARWRAYPDRVQALAMLRAAGEATGVYVWRYGAGGELVTLEAEQERLLPVLRATLEEQARDLFDGWSDEPEPVRRALVWLLTVLPSLHDPYAALVDATLPPEHREAWALATQGWPESDDEADAVAALETWALTA